LTGQTKKGAPEGAPFMLLYKLLYQFLLPWQAMLEQVLPL
jgi:hypothetical protein